ncbi:MAG: glycosyltransferase family 4 protein [Anaerolineae bacterium]|nr:glycosyltransferase family 4 protein [Anaerolineae bacterium]
MSSEDKAGGLRILFIVPHYRPDGGPGAQLFTLLCEALVRRGHLPAVLTAVPHYPSGRVPEEYRGRRPAWSLENRVRVARVALPSLDRRSLWRRLVQFGCYQLGATLAGWKQKADVVLAVSPALEVWLPCVLLAFARGRPVVYSVHDVYPDVGVQLGIFRHGPVIRAVGALEDSLLRRAAAVRILSDSFARLMLSRGVPESRLHLVYDWVDTELVRPLPRDNDFSRQHGLSGRFVVLYAGNVGQIQGLESVLEAAALLRARPDVLFLFVGDGTARESLQARARRMGLDNVRFLPYQPLETMPWVWASADVGLVSLIKGAGLGALPSKSFAILASGRPLLASIDEASDLVALVGRARAGMCVPPQCPPDLAAAVLRLGEEPVLRAEMGQNGRAYALRHHSPEAAAARFEELLAAVLAGSAPAAARSTT